MANLNAEMAADFSKFVAECGKAEQAMDGLQAEAVQTGKAVSDSAADMESAGKKTATGFGGLATNLRSVDKTMGAFGVNISKEIGLLDELGEMSGKTAGQLGKLATASSVLAAAIGGWQIGRKIAELTGADEKIADLAATMTGQGSVAAETYRAKLDTIRKAILDGYQGMPSYTQAIEYNTKRAAENAAAHVSGAGLIAMWDRQLKQAANGGLAELNKEITAGTMTVEQMSAKFQVNVQAIGYQQQKLANEAKATKASREEHEKFLATMEGLNEKRQGAAAILDGISSRTIAAIARDRALGATQQELAVAYDKSAVQIQAVIDKLDAQEKVTKQVTAANTLMATERAKFYQEQTGLQATSLEQQRLAIGTWRAETMKALFDTGKATQAMYEEVAIMAEQKLRDVGVDWETLRAGSIKTLREQYEAAELTYQRMKGATDTYTAAAIKNAEAERDARLAALQAAEGAHSAMYTQWLEREKAFSASLTKYDTDRATAQQVSMEAQTKALDDAIAYAQAYGVSLETAQRTLGQLTDEGTQGMRNVAAATQDVRVQLQQVDAAARTVYESLQAGQALMEAYSRGTSWVQESPAVAGYNFMRASQGDTQIPTYGNLTRASAEPWGRGGNTLNVNVNNAGAQDIANKLVTEMRHQGVRF